MTTSDPQQKSSYAYHGEWGDCDASVPNPAQPEVFYEDSEYNEESESDTEQGKSSAHLTGPSGVYQKRKNKNNNINNKKKKYKKKKYQPKPRVTFKKPGKRCCYHACTHVLPVPSGTSLETKLMIRVANARVVSARDPDCKFYQFCPSQAEAQHRLTGLLRDIDNLPISPTAKARKQVKAVSMAAHFTSFSSCQEKFKAQVSRVRNLSEAARARQPTVEALAHDCSPEEQSLAFAMSDGPVPACYDWGVMMKFRRYYADTRRRK